MTKKRWYLCNPWLARYCKKTGCYMNDGPCMATSNPDSAMRSFTGKRLIIVSDFIYIQPEESDD